MKKKILIVDDNRMMLNFLTTTLEREGHHVVPAEDGFSALEILTSFTPDVMFVDLIMPKIRGDKLCQIVRKMQNMESCYLVIISAAVAEMDLDYRNIGADRCIAKGPFGKMAEHVLAAVKASDSPRQEEIPKQIIGIDDVYARQMTKELLLQNRHLETILDSIAEAILEVYSERVVYANSAAVSLFGMPQEHILASYFISLFDDTLRPSIESMLASSDGQAVEIGLNNPLELNGRQVTIKILPVKSDPLTTIILITDVTERRRLQMQLQHIQKMESIGTIASGVAHNFRNTLAGILVNSQVLQMNYRDDADLISITDRIDTSVKRGVQLVEGLMQFSRKQIKKEFKRLNLTAVIQETHQLIKESFDKKIDIHIDLPESLPIMGDHSGISQALMNLCTNARDAMPLGGELRIEAKPEGKYALVTVSDTGHGMDKNTVQKCFDPFFTTKEVGKGTGLGLSTTYGIVKSHDGQIRVDSEPDKGSVFKLRFPLAFSDQKEKREFLSEIVRGTGEKILIVDDELEMLKALPVLLNSLGYQAEIAGSGKEAIEMYKTWQPDVVLMDINMPEMDGITCIEKIMEYDSDADIIIVSGYEEEGLNGFKEDKKRYIKGYLTKPVGMNELSALLAQLLGK
ncbi:MAG: response regulator [Proteobacteria bacterium]|nr:response regulator [Pseudomonadota bacterium]